jgi:hypothetical protein
VTRDEIIQRIRQAKNAIMLCPGAHEMRAAGIPGPAVARIERGYTELDLALSLIVEAIPEHEVEP